MNVLIVSFDKNLVNQLREILKEQNVIDVKNGEEAINTAPPFVDVVIYDAVAGSISEEDINNMYRQKFRDTKYIILVDDIFPVDMNNIIPSNKVKLMRDEAPSKIKELLAGSPIEMPASFQEAPPQPPQEVTQPQEESLSLEKFFFETEQLEGFPSAYEIQKEETPEAVKPKTPSGKKLLIVSFDGNLINKLKGVLSEEVRVIEASNMKEVADKAKEADIIIFDTILGMLARKTLMDMSRESHLKEKPYILLVDELFTIDVEDIPLKRKYKFARESELSKAVEKALELIKETEPEGRAPTFEVKETGALEETPLPQEEAKEVMSLLEEIMGSGVKEEERVKEESAISFEEEKQKPAGRVEYVPQPIELGSLVDSLSTVIRNTLISQLSRENLYSALSRVIKQEDIKEYISGALKDMLENLLREQIQSALAKIDVSQLVREEAYKVLKERLNELIT